MAYSKPKTSFGIDQILDETDSSLTASNPTQCVDYIPRMSSNGIVHHHQHDPVFDPYSFNIHSSSNFASSMVAPPQPPPPLPPPQFLPPAYHVDQYPSVFQKVHDFWSFYSHPFGGYFLPAYAFKRKGGQIRFTPQQVQHLEQYFISHKYLSPDERKKLASRLKLSDRQVKTWFQNRRAKHRRGNIDGNSSTNELTLASERNELNTEPTSSSTYPSTTSLKHLSHS